MSGHVPHIVVLAPMPLELDAVVEAFGLERSGVAGGGWTGRVGSSTVSAHLTGMGPARAGEQAFHLLDGSRPDVPHVDHVMVVGVCGGLDPDLPVGTVLHPDVVVDESTGAAYRHVPPGGWPAVGGIVTTAEVSFDVAHSRQLAAEGFLGVDMETSAVARACVARDRPWSVHRCISDRYVDGLLDPRIVALTDADGTVDIDAVGTTAGRGTCPGCHARPVGPRHRRRRPTGGRGRVCRVRRPGRRTVGVSRPAPPDPVGPVGQPPGRSRAATKSGARRSLKAAMPSAISGETVPRAWKCASRSSDTVSAVSKVALSSCLDRPSERVGPRARR